MSNATKTDSAGLRIIELRAENLKKLRAVTITPTGDLVQITGKNGAGKSSVLDAIWWALAGTKAIQKMPIRRGEERAFVKVSLGRERVQLVVTREFSAGGSVVRVESPEGARFPAPQTMLDALLGELTFDPLEFAQSEPREQFEALRAIASVDVDLDELDGLNRADFEKRTGVNRDVKAKRNQADAIQISDGDLPALVDVAGLKDRMAEASQINVEIEARRGRRDQVALDIRARLQIAREKREAAARFLEAAAEIEAEAAGLQTRLDEAPALPAPVDVSALRAELDRAERANASVSRETNSRARKATLVMEADALERQSRELTAAMDERTKTKAEAIARAPMPVEGLGFGDGVVTFGGVPFDQASSAEQLRVSVAIAMAANPKLRVLRIKEGSLLDADNLALLATMASERGYQVWIETVGTGGRVGIEIAEGEVVRVDGEPVGEKASA